MVVPSGSLLWEDTVRTPRSGTARRQPPLEAKQSILKAQQQLLPLVRRVLAVPLLLVLELSHDVNQCTEILPELLGLCLELLDILHERDQLPGQGIKLLEHRFGSGSLQRGQEGLGFRPQTVNVLLVMRHLFVQTLHLSQTLLDGGFIVRSCLEGNFCGDGVLHALYLRTHYNIHPPT
jgi:hypothetical protein